MKKSLSRRGFIGSAATVGAGLALGVSKSTAAGQTAPARTPATTPSATAWPITDAREETALIEVLRSGKWGRTGNGGVKVKEFEALFAEKSKAKFCLATSSGTTALLTSLGALNIGPGDEVILPPYTFVATFNAITASFALPVFADTDAATFQVDPKTISAALTPATKLLLPVHIGGSTCDLDAIAAISQARKVPLLEDACQAPLATYRGQPVGTKGIGGCFSFQASKNLTAGEGGAIVTNDETFANQCFNFHSPGGGRPVPSLGRGSNYRLTEFQAALLLAQYTRFEEQQRLRNENAEHLTAMLQKIPGITPTKPASGQTRSGWHLYMMRYDASRFAGLTRAKFLKALSDAGIGASGGYGSLNTSPHVQSLATNPHYQRIYGKDAMARWLERSKCPVNDRVVEEGVWFPQTRLLAPRSEMERVAEVIAGIQKRAGDLAKV